MSLQNIMTRREALVRMASVMVTVSLMPYSRLTFAEKSHAAASPLEFAQFLNISRKITEHETLDPALSARYFSALNQQIPAFASALPVLYAISQQAPDALAFNQQAIRHGLGEIMTAIVTAWYTGTVAVEGSGHTELVSYKDALMYKTTRDALIVPTWCTYGPMWWLGLPPGVTREPTVPATDLPQAQGNNA
ncbi:sorbitol dehydrogenase family protein [Shimwellia blattae]|nr:sorbitol dehydrogenase family protein [Shimwellia blattae]GAB80808.1 putative dehydrogenase [Shimwellia blattae DSM 4481 = NBRC 105725]VDY64563.1 Membrane bound FAD containing D-sorbitol dehydrogenase [Shimwellia blattae]VEC22671.1 Membrane bound FAD containing D-sorbitol dehydrogenase [Shimwellia blattae]